MRRILPLRPLGVAVQQAILVLVSLALMQVAIFLWFVNRGPPPPPDQGFRRAAAAAWLLGRVPEPQRPALLQDLVADSPELGLLTTRDAPPGVDWDTDAEKRHLWPMPGGRVGFAPSGDDGASAAEGGKVVFELDNGAFLVANADQPGPPPLSSILVPTLALLAALLAVLTFWAMRSLTMPLRRFDSAVERFGHDAVDPVLLTEEGPAELREAARAFNRMQRRISRLVEDRTRMLAAVSHDLRTPVTRVRLHAEAISSDELRDQILANLDEMDRLLEGALVQLRDGGSSEKPVDVDLFSLVQTVVERTADCGAAVSFDGKPGGRVRGQPEALMRLFDNLIDNALKYGGSATVTLDWDASRARVRVIDHGQGIADDAKAGLLEPFTRGDCSRNRDSGSGFGLGLSIADAIARSHKGSIALEDTPGGGLTVLVTLPAQTPTV